MRRAELPEHGSRLAAAREVAMYLTGDSAVGDMIVEGYTDPNVARERIVRGAAGLCQICGVEPATLDPEGSGQNYLCAACEPGTRGEMSEERR